MFTIPLATNCPRTRGGQGRIYIPTDILVQLSSTLKDQKGLEWALLLCGKRESNGREIWVEGFEVPSQTRSSGAVDLDTFDLEEWHVGALHSHHSMGAYFSSKDIGDYNKKFGCSIVISTKFDTDEGKVLGFEYEAVGKVLMGCGTLGLWPMRIVPIDRSTRQVVEDWPEEWIQLKDDVEGADLGDCPKQEWTYPSTVKIAAKAACGLEDSYLAVRAFGDAPSTITPLLPKALPLQPSKVSGGARRGRRRYVWNTEEERLEEQIDPYEHYYRGYGKYGEDSTSGFDSLTAAAGAQLALVPKRSDEVIEPMNASTIDEWKSKRELRALVEKDPDSADLKQSEIDERVEILYEYQETYYTMLYDKPILDDTIGRTSNLLAAHGD